MSEDDPEYRDRISTITYEPDLEGMAEMVDLLVVVARADGRIDEHEASSLFALINTLRRSVLSEPLNAQIVRQSVLRLKRDGVQATVDRVGCRLGELKLLADGLALARDVAEADGSMTELEWTTLVLAGRAGGMDRQRIKSIIGEPPA